MTYVDKEMNLLQFGSDPADTPSSSSFVCPYQSDERTPGRTILSTTPCSVQTGTIGRSLQVRFHGACPLSTLVSDVLLTVFRMQGDMNCCAQSIAVFQGCVRSGDVAKQAKTSVFYHRRDWNTTRLSTYRSRITWLRYWRRYALCVLSKLFIVYSRTQPMV